jgi:hypothetical protein
VYLNYEWHPFLEMVIFVLDMKHTSWELTKIWIHCEKHLKFIICFHSMFIPSPLHKILQVLPLLVSLWQRCKKPCHLECMFHFQCVNFQGWSPPRHKYHSTKGNVHLSFFLWNNLVSIKDLHNLKFVVDIFFLLFHQMTQASCLKPRIHHRMSITH